MSNSSERFLTRVESKGTLVTNKVDADCLVNEARYMSRRKILKSFISARSVVLSVMGQGSLFWQGRSEQFLYSRQALLLDHSTIVCCSLFY